VLKDSVKANIVRPSHAFLRGYKGRHLLLDKYECAVVSVLSDSSWIHGWLSQVRTSSDKVVKETHIKRKSGIDILAGLLNYSGNCVTSDQLQ
jgi:hypothetical protein